MAVIGPFEKRDRARVSGISNGGETISGRHHTVFSGLQTGVGHGSKARERKHRFGTSERIRRGRRPLAVISVVATQAVSNLMTVDVAGPGPNEVDDLEKLQCTIVRLYCA